MEDSHLVRSSFAESEAILSYTEDPVCTVRPWLRAGSPNVSPHGNCTDPVGGEGRSHPCVLLPSAPPTGSQAGCCEVHSLFLLRGVIASVLNRDRTEDTGNPGVKNRFSSENTTWGNKPPHGVLHSHQGCFCGAQPSPRREAQSERGKGSGSLEILGVSDPCWSDLLHL